MNEQAFYFNTEDKNQRIEAKERLGMVEEQIDMSEQMILQDGYLKLKIKDLIIHYQFMFIAENLFYFNQKTMTSNK